MPTNKPAGSGWFSLSIGITFILMALTVWCTGKSPQELVKPERVLVIWMIVAGLIMATWGIVRSLSTTAKKDYRIGQETINMCVGIIAATFAIWAIIAVK